MKDHRVSIPEGAAIIFTQIMSDDSDEEFQKFLQEVGLMHVLANIYFSETMLSCLIQSASRVFPRLLPPTYLNSQNQEILLQVGLTAC